MFEHQEALFNDIQKICHIIRTVSKMDIRFLNDEGVPMLQLTSHTEPAVIQNSYEEFQSIQETLKSHDSYAYHSYLNSYGLEYISTAIRRQGLFFGSIILGPFLSTTPCTDFINTVISKNQVPISSRKQLQEFYTSLSVVSSSFPGRMGDLLVNLCENSFIQAQLITDETNQPIQNKKQVKENIIESKHIIEQRYKNEKLIMNAIAKGDKKEVEQLMKGVNDFDDRIPESPIRSTKNLLIVLNTLGRVAAANGGVHPIYIHDLSDKLARLIEQANNLAYLKNLNNVIFHEYCQLVEEYSTQNYSSIVRKAINHINLHLEESLTLKSIAETIPVHLSHLSRTFKQETGMNVIEYIQKQRVETAKIYLQSEDISITDIAFMVGFNDVNYFSRVFKKNTGMTPSQYVKKSARG